MALIYIVEDDKNIAEIETYALRNAGYEVRDFSCAKDFYKALAYGVPHLFLLDIMLPDEDGISVLKKLRASPATAEIPVIMATAKGTEFDKVIGLDQGADDYLSKPFGMMEMVSRVKAVLRRSAPRTEAALLQYRNIEMNESSHRVSVSGVGVELTVKEYALLRLFLKNPGVAFTRENLLSAVWESDYQGETRTVDVHIASLRTKLKDAGEFIRTVRGVGYRLEDPT